ncbi:hypothetical protein [Corticicoccus populi]|uniref:Uncharacterized protein n=1 Tax=Corticicoccus populi TaxID=1812821 RepID=A0ABW5WU71_9STAP
MENGYEEGKYQAEHDFKELLDEIMINEANNHEVVSVLAYVKNAYE